MVSPDDLEIPAFLRAENRPASAPVRPRRKPARKVPKTTEVHDLFVVHLNDEIPLLGSGVRLVELVQLGRKWVRIKKPGSDRHARIPIKLWYSLRPRKKEATLITT